VSLEWQVKDKWQANVHLKALHGLFQHRLTRQAAAIREALRSKGDQ